MNVKELSNVWGMKPNGVLHVGAHQGEEALDYEKFGWLPVIWIEAQPLLAKNLHERLDPEKHSVINATIWDQNGIKMKFKLASNSQSSSLLAFGTHAEDYPEVSYTEAFEVTTRRLDSLLSDVETPNFVNLDIQGAEGMALKGLGKSLNAIDAIYTEVNRKEVYLGCTMIKDLDIFLEDAGFSRVATRWILGRGWGDALYLRRTAYRPSLKQKVKALFFAQRHYQVQVVGNLKRALRSSFDTLSHDN
ncbi:MAG: FkbM family methyltransferase [Actinobacteria bacterium]|nr:FkbM family methyltransferase [Actinomycetota bacterium]